MAARVSEKTRCSTGPLRSPRVGVFFSSGTHLRRKTRIDGDCIALNEKVRTRPH